MEYETANCVSYDLLKQFAYENRGNPTAAEKIMWDILKGNNLGYRFRRQHIIGDFIADFVCLKKKLVIEIDGGYHSENKQQILDEQRTYWLEKQGYKVIRFTNEQVFTNIEQVIREIKVELYE